MCLLKDVLKKIKLVVLDCDSVLTDSRVWYSPTGVLLKSFHVRDGFGIESLKSIKIRVVFLTHKYCPILKKRAEDLEVEFFSSKDKLKKFKEIKGNVSFEEACYVGDDVFDISLLKEVGFSACPNDAHKDVKKVVTYVAKQNGGQGVVREICDMFLEANI